MLGGPGASQPLCCCCCCPWSTAAAAAPGLLFGKPLVSPFIQHGHKQQLHRHIYSVSSALDVLGDTVRQLPGTGARLQPVGRDDSSQVAHPKTAAVAAGSIPQSSTPPCPCLQHTTRTQLITMRAWPATVSYCRRCACGMAATGCTRVAAPPPTQTPPLSAGNTQDIGQ